MSLAATNYVLKRKFGNQIRKLLMVVIADFAGESGESWPSIDTLAERAECSRRSVQEHLQILAVQGEIAIVANAGRGGTNLYRIIFKNHRVEGDFPEGVQEVQGGVQMGGAQTAGGGADGRRSFAPESLGTSYEPSGTSPPLPPPGREGEPAGAVRDEELIANVRGLRETWHGPPVLNHDELRAFRKNRHVLVHWEAEDWAVVREFLNAATPKGSAYCQWVILREFLKNSSGSLAQARAWKGKQRPRLEVVPKQADGPAATTEDMAELLAAFKKPEPRRMKS